MDDMTGLLTEIDTAVAHFLSGSDPSAVTRAAALADRLLRLIDAPASHERPPRWRGHVNSLAWYYCCLCLASDSDVAERYLAVASTLFDWLGAGPQHVNDVLMFAWDSATSWLETEQLGSEPQTSVEPDELNSPEIIDTAVAEVVDEPSVSQSGADFGSEDRIRSLLDQTMRFWQRFNEERDAADLDRAISTARRVIRLMPTRDIATAGMLCHIAAALSIRDGRGGRDLNEAITSARRGLKIARTEHSALEVNLSSILVDVLRSRFDRRRRDVDLDEAVSVAKAMAEHPDAKGNSRRLTELVWTLKQRYRAGGSVPYLIESTAIARSALAVADSKQRPQCQVELADVLHELYLVSLDEKILSEATLLLRTVCDNRIRVDDARARWLCTAATTLHEIYALTGDGNDLDRSVSMMRECVVITDWTSRKASHYWNDLGAILLTRSAYTGHGVDSAAAIRAFWNAVRLSATDPALREGALTNLGAALARRYEQTGNYHDLDLAIRILGQDPEIVRSDREGFAIRLSLLSMAWTRDYELTGRRACLEFAVAAARRAVNTLSDTTFEWQAEIQVLVAIQIALQARYDLFRSTDDLAETVETSHRLLRHIPMRSPHRVLSLFNLATALRERFQRTQNRADLLAAIDHLRDARKLCDIHDPHRGPCSSELGRALLLKYAQDRDNDDLVAAIGFAREATDTKGPGSPIRYPVLVTGLIHALRAKVDEDEDPRAEDLNLLVQLAETVVEVSQPGALTFAGNLINLASVLYLRFEHKQQDDDLLRALVNWRTAANTSSGPADVRLIGATAWADGETQLGKNREALTAYALAISLLPAWAWHGNAIGDRHWALRKHSGLAVNAAAVALECELKDQALTQLEHGRSVIWSQLLQIRGNLTELEKVAPDYARRLYDLRQELDRPEPSGTVLVT